jgi:hypothetical protein
VDEGKNKIGREKKQQDHFQIVKQLKRGRKSMREKCAFVFTLITAVYKGFFDIERPCRAHLFLRFGLRLFQGYQGYVMVL